MLRSRVNETNIVATSNLYIMKFGAFHINTLEAAFCVCCILRLSLPIAHGSSAGVWAFATCEAHTPFKLLSSTSITHLAFCKGLLPSLLYSIVEKLSRVGSSYDIYTVSVSVES